MEVFELDGAIAADMAPFHAVKLEEQVLRLERPPDLDVHRAGDRVARHVPQHIVVRVDVNRALKIEIQRLVPEQARVLVSLAGAAGDFHGGDGACASPLRSHC